MITINTLKRFARYALTGAAVATSAYCAYRLREAILSDRSDEFDDFNSLGDDLAMDHLVEDNQVALSMRNNVERVELLSIVPDISSCVNNVVRDGMELELTPVKEKRHRRIGTHKRVTYTSTVVAECRVRFGLPIDNAVNRMAVRRYASNLMYTHGLRPTHVARILEDVVEMVFHESCELVNSRKLRGGLFRSIRGMFTSARPESN
jgi:hypothetical protein